MKAILLLAVLVLSAPMSLAQLNLETCNVVFSQGIRDNYYLLTEREQFETYQHRLCDTQLTTYQSFQQTAAGLNLSVPLAEGLLGLSGSGSDKQARFSQAYRQFCSATYFDAAAHDRYQSYISQVSSALTASWNRCQELQLNAWLNSKGVFIAITPFGDMSSFVAEVKVKQPGTPTATVIKSLAPEGSVECRNAGVKLTPNSSINSNEFQLTCTKHPSLAIPFAVETNFGLTPTVTVPAATSKILELSEKLDSLRGELQKLRAETGAASDGAKTRLTGIEDRLSKWGATEWVPVGYAGSHTDTSGWCKPGWYVIGFDLDATGPGAYVQVGRALCARP